MKGLSLFFVENNSMMRTGDAISAGIHPVTIYSMRQRGIIEQISRGLYRLTDGAVHINPDIVAVSMKIPGGVNLSHLRTLIL